MAYPTFSQTLYELRIARRLSQKDLAELVGIPQSTIANYESQRTNISQQNLLKLAGFFRVPISRFYGGVEKPVDVSDLSERKIELVKSYIRVLKEE
ncbi:helix-turn-helix transcriptional regulator [Clostridium sp. D33t1_170424_F3]|uniref:helix-turn-helix domain-containing protein n=1 Tax=Clostridium sp. D33t1_170424_F3 TaxID=2787099 RepID=UPI0018A94770|nr:helix-turn-helix transcriptional regulator [Clostridium sp. D33t1_170424_F3]